MHYEKTFDLAMDFLISNEYKRYAVKNIYISAIENFEDDLFKRIINLIKKTIIKNTNEMPNYYDLDSIIKNRRE